MWSREETINLTRIIVVYGPFKLQIILWDIPVNQLFERTLGGTNLLTGPLKVGSRQIKNYLTGQSRQ